MKTKKILAIVTLVAFMISILPMAAFAIAADGANPYTSTLEVKDSSAAADGTDYIEIEVFTKDLDFVVGEYKVYVATSRPGADKINGDVYNSTTKALPVEAGADGKATIKITSAVPGKLNVVVGAVGVADVQDVYDYATGVSGATATAAGALKTAEGVTLIPVEFTAASAGSLTATPLVGNTAAGSRFANDSDNYEIVATLKATNGAPIAGKEVSFSIASAGARLSASKVTTDYNGVAKTKIYATKPGEYEVTVKAEGKTYTTGKIGFNPIGIYEIKSETDQGKKLASDEDVVLEFSFTDGKNAYKVITPDAAGVSSTTTGMLKDLKLTNIKEPSGASLASDMVIGSGNDYTAAKNADDNLEITIPKAKVDKEGDYTIKATLANGKYATVDFTVKKFGDIDKMTLSYSNAVLAGGSTSVAPTVKWVDVNGVEKNATVTTFTVDNPVLASIVPATNGKVKANNDDKTGVVTVTAIDTPNKLVATAAVTIVKPAATLKVTAPSYTKVGETAKVTVQLVDVDGKAVANGNAIAGGSTAAYVTSSPSGSIATASVPAGSDFAKNGNASLDVVCNTVGQVTVQVVIDDGTSVFVGNGVVAFGEEAASQKPLTMFIGATNYMVGGEAAVTDAAPFIQNGRTFVAVRPIGDALGMTIYWDAATQTVTMTKPGETVTIVVGAATFKVDRAGVVTEYPTDAPAQINDGRTYLPFRAIGEAMGYEVNFDAATQSVTFK